MRIALLGSVSSIIPPTGQAAIEQLVYEQALGLAKRGHTILLFAPTGSVIDHPNITIIPVATKALLSGDNSTEESIYGSSYKLRLEIVNLSSVIHELISRKEYYDIVMNNLRGEGVVWEIARQLDKPLYHIMHLPLFPELINISAGIHLISISRNQQKQFPNHAYSGIVYNAVNEEIFTYNANAENYVLYLGSIGANKNPKDAIIAAKLANIPLKIGGRIKDQHYYDTEIKPFIDQKSVIWIGEVSKNEIINLYKHAQAFLFPTKWNEPFGLVAVESMSCGTPVIAYPNGALPEIVDEGINGYLVHNPQEMAQKILEIHKISRQVCRDSIIKKFSIKTMIDSIETILTKSV